MRGTDPIDPRGAAVADRLAGVSRVVGVTGSKGGIGKSVVASLLALARADAGHAVGLFDLDFTSPTDHVVLGVDAGFPSETFGIDPYRAHGVALMSVAFLTGDAPTPLRGAEATSALLELFAITRWGELDVLVLDMPPGLADTTLDILRFVPQAEFLVVANPSQMVIGSVRRALTLLTELEVPILGVVENQPRFATDAVRDLAGSIGVPFLGSVPFDGELEPALGDVSHLRRTDAYVSIRDIGSATLAG